jgi:hypothetical protein
MNQFLEMIILPNEFYTTAEQEAELDAIYKQEVDKKQKEIDEENKRTKKIHKYRATMYIYEKERVFYISERGYRWKDANGPLMPTSPQPGGKIYKLDLEADRGFESYPGMSEGRLGDEGFETKIEHSGVDEKGLVAKYCEDHSEFYVKFKPICSGGIAYCAKENVYPAYLECAAHKLIVEDDNKYDIYCF